MRQRSDGEQRFIAIQFAIDFLVELIAEQRTAAVKEPAREGGGVEQMLADAISLVPTVSELRKWTEIEERGGPADANERAWISKTARKIQSLNSVIDGAETAEELRDDIDRKAEAIAEAIPKTWRERREAAVYEGQEKALAGMRASSAAMMKFLQLHNRQARLNQIDQRSGGVPHHHQRLRAGIRNEIERVDVEIASALAEVKKEEQLRRDLEHQLGNLLNDQHELHEEAILVACAEREPNQSDRDRYGQLKTAIRDTRAELEKLDSARVFGNVTEVRHALSDRTEGESGELRRVERQIEDARNELPTTAEKTVGRRRLKAKLAELETRRRRLEPSGWKTFGSKTEVLKLAKRAGLTKDRKPPKSEPNS